MNLSIRLIAGRTRQFLLCATSLLALLASAPTFAQSAEPKNLAEKVLHSPARDTNKHCPAGSFIDLANGGGCYTCPPGHERSAAPIWESNACFIPAGEELLRATRHKKTAWPHDCSKGQFHDAWDGGSCWSCPPGSNRTGHHVASEKACSRPVGEHHAKAIRVPDVYGYWKGDAPGAASIKPAVAPAAAAAGGQKAWMQLPGAAGDVGMGAGSLWAIGANPVAGGQGVYRWDGKTWVNMNAGAVRLDVDMQGNAWTVNDKGEIWRHDGRAWNRVPGIAKDIGIGANGAVWVIGAGATAGGFEIFRWNNGNWQKMPGGGTRIDVDPQGNAWVVSDGGDVFRYTGSNWAGVPGVKARDIGIGGDGSIFVVGQDGSVHKWNGNAWVRRDGKLAEITVDAQGVPFGTSDNKQIWMGYP